MPKKKTHEQFIAEVKEIFNDDIEILGKYDGNKKKILVRYKRCGHEGYKTPVKLLCGQGCGKCKNKAISKAKTKGNDWFENNLHSKGIEYIEVIGEYKGVRNKVLVKNLNCGHEYQAAASNILNGSGCPICHGIKDKRMFVDIIKKKYPGEYEILGEYINGITPILTRHKCGYEWEVMPKTLLRDITCPNCIMSKGEYFIKKYLTERNIEFVPQYVIKDCRDINPLPFDFMVVINGEKKLIEFDGQQHYRKERSLYKNSSVFKHDEIKNKYCEKNGIKLLRIPYWWLRNERIIKELDEFCSQ